MHGISGLIGVVIVTNGALSSALLENVEKIVGVQTGMLAVHVENDCDCRRKQEEIGQAIRSVDDGSGVIVVTDLHGSSPQNLSLKACNGSNCVILSGANLPMLVELTRRRKEKLQDAADFAVQKARKYVLATRLG